MIQNVYQRIQKGKRSKYWTGRYSLERGVKPTTVALGLTDKAAAIAKLQEIVTEKQQEKYNVIPKKSYRDAGSLPIGALITSYEADLKAQERKPNHIKETIARLRKVVVACKWRRLRDITPSNNSMPT